MSESYTIKPIAHIRSDYNEKFGIPRQPGLVTELEQSVIIDPDFSNIDAVRGLEDFSHIWLIWSFSENAFDMSDGNVKWYPTVRPPRLGGKARKGVWSTRSPYRPNSLGMSSVRLLRIELDGVPINESDRGMTSGELALIVSGADLMNGTPIFDIKPYIPYSDSHPDANGGFTDSAEFSRLVVVFPEELLSIIPESKRAGLIQILELDPRGAYEKQPGYTYGMSFADWDIRFMVEESILKVTDVVDLENNTAKAK